MKWIELEERLPRSKGLYAITNNLSSRNCMDFGFLWFDGTAFIFPPEILNKLAPYRNPLYWATPEWGRDNGEMQMILNECQISGCKCKNCGRTAISAEFAKREWISVKDKVPEVDVEVLVYLKRGDIEIRFRHNEEYEDEQDPCARYVWSDQGIINDVLAWMPLPQPPKKEKGN